MSCVQLNARCLKDYDGLTYACDAFRFSIVIKQTVYEVRWTRNSDVSSHVVKAAINDGYTEGEREAADRSGKFCSSVVLGCWACLQVEHS